MSKLIIKDSFGVTEIKGKPVVSSRYVAEVFQKRHDNVMQAIENSNCSSEFRNLNFKESFYKSGKGKYKEYLITRDGFSFVVMGFTGKEADKFKEDYIKKFNEMEEFIKSLINAKLEFPEFTDAIMSAHEEPKHYHFSNEINMINKIVLGVDAKKYKEQNNLPIEVGSIRPYLSTQQIKFVEALQKFDIGLITVVADYNKRKEILTNYFNKINKIKLLA